MRPAWRGGKPVARLALQLLGPVAISYDGRPLDHFRTKAVQALLVYLVCRPEVHRRESLMALLWPEANQTSAQNNLRQALYHLRKAVPELSANPSAEPVPFILADHQVVQVNPQAAFDLDTAAFQRLLDDHHARWPEAVNLYRGDFLCDFYLPHSAPFEAWVLACRADLRSQALGALDTLVTEHMARGALETAAQFARQQLVIDDLHESGHRRLLEILLRLGQRSQALAHYDAYCRHLAETLGIGPSAECVRLVEQVKNTATATSLAAAAEPRRCC